MADLPKTYRGAHIGNGYLVSINPDVSEHEIYTTMMNAADVGDAIAQQILLALPYGNKYEIQHLRDATGVLMSFKGKDTLILEHGHFPHSFRGKCIPRVQAVAESGNATAIRLLAHIARQRICNPNFEVIDRG